MLCSVKTKLGRLYGFLETGAFRHADGLEVVGQGNVVDAMTRAAFALHIGGVKGG